MENNLGNKEIMAKNIRRFLEIKHMTIKDLASAIDVPYNTVNDWAKQALKNQRLTAFAQSVGKVCKSRFLLKNIVL